MKSAVETLEPTRVKLSVEVSYDELKPSFDAAYREIAQQVNIPGFRKGKVPPRIIDQRLGRGVVIERAVNEALPDFYRQAVQASEIKPLGQPDVEVTGIPDPASAGGELTFTAEVDVRPEIVLPDLAGLSVTVPAADVTDEHVAERLEALRERFGTLVGVDRAAADGDFVVLDLAATIGDETVDSVSGVSYQIGSETMLPGLDEALVGLVAGQTATFTSPLAGGDRAGEDAQIAVTPTAVKRRDLPEVDDDFAQLASEFDTVAELREDLREQAAGALRNEQAVAAREALLTALREAVDFPVPSGVVEAEVSRHLESEGRAEDDEHREEVRAEATQTLRDQLLLDALSESLAVSVGQEELIEFLLHSARRFNVDPGTFISNADSAGQIPHYVSELARTKAIALALREVTVVDDAGQPVDLGAVLGVEDTDLGDDLGDEDLDDEYLDDDLDLDEDEDDDLDDDDLDDDAADLDEEAVVAEVEQVTTDEDDETAATRA